MAHKTVEPEIDARKSTGTEIDIASLPEHERWLYENPEALASVKRGLADLAAGRVHKRQSYAQYADLEVGD